MVEIVDKPAAIAAPPGHAGTMLQVIKFRICMLPFLQGHTLPSQPKLDWRNHKLKAL
jgi:hypothetical protein